MAAAMATRPSQVLLAMQPTVAMAEDITQGQALAALAPTLLMGLLPVVEMEAGTIHTVGGLPMVTHLVSRASDCHSQGHSMTCMALLTAGMAGRDPCAVLRYAVLRCAVP